jgi:hypothetical protein
MNLSWAGKLLAAGVGLRIAAAGLRHVADNMDDGSGGGTVQLSADQINAAQHFANATGITLREAVLRLYNLNLID